MARVFISYRRDDNAHFAGRLRDQLAREFGDDNVFFDVDSVSPGSSVRDSILSTVNSTDLVLVLIGSAWGPSRLRDPHDFVFFEIQSAFRAGKWVIPVLICDAPMPLPSELPAEIQQLSDLNAARVRADPDFRTDVGRLTAIITGTTDPPVDRHTPHGSATPVTWIRSLKPTRVGERNAPPSKGLTLAGKARGVVRALAEQDVAGSLVLFGTLLFAVSYFMTWYLTEGFVTYTSHYGYSHVWSGHVALLSLLGSCVLIVTTRAYNASQPTILRWPRRAVAVLSGVSFLLVSARAAIALWTAYSQQLGMMLAFVGVLMAVTGALVGAKSPPKAS